MEPSGTVKQKKSYTHTSSGGSKSLKKDIKQIRGKFEEIYLITSRRFGIERKKIWKSAENLLTRGQKIEKSSQESIEKPASTLSTDKGSQKIRVVSS